jgi:hypothetical protein
MFQLGVLHSRGNTTVFIPSNVTKHYEQFIVKFIKVTMKTKCKSMELSHVKIQ